MTRFLTRRLLIIPPILLLASFLGFSYAHLVRPIRASPSRVSKWVPFTSTIGLGMPSFFIGTLLVVGADAEALCQAYSSASDEPLWEINLGADVTPTGGALAEGKLYVSTEEGTLFVLENAGSPN